MNSVRRRNVLRPIAGSESAAAERALQRIRCAQSQVTDRLTGVGNRGYYAACFPVLTHFNRDSMKFYCPECETRYEGDEYDVCPDDGSRLFRLDSADDDGDPLLNTVVDERFRIEELVGTGGMGAVYRGVQLSVQRSVAIKVLRPELVDREVMLERFFREAKVVSELTHPNIVRLVDFGQDEELDLLYLVMELVDGTDLGDLLERGRLRTNMALEVVYQICGALTEPHARGIVHRDLKPENLIMMPISDGTLQIKVLDFGIARALEGGTKLTKTGMICGTPSYMSPEQAQNEELDGRTDLYALGVMLFEMLTGRPPYVGETSLQVLLNHIQKPVPRLSTLVPPGVISPEVSDLVRQLMAKDPEERPKSARRVRDHIDLLRRQLDLHPVRLSEETTGAEAFDAWILPGVELGDHSGDSADELDSELPVGFAESSTGEVGAPRGETGELAADGAEERRSEGTDLEYVGVAETLAAGETPAPTEREAIQDAEPSSTTGEEHVDAEQWEKPEPEPTPTLRSKDSPTAVNREIAGRASADVAGDTQRANPSSAVDVLTNPLVVGLGALFFLAFAGAAGILAYHFVIGADGDDPVDDERARAVAQDDEGDEEVEQSADDSDDEDVEFAQIEGGDDEDVEDDDRVDDDGPEDDDSVGDDEGEEVAGETASAQAPEPDQDADSGGDDGSPEPSPSTGSEPSPGGERPGGDESVDIGEEEEPTATEDEPDLAPTDPGEEVEASKEEVADDEAPAEEESPPEPPTPDDGDDTDDRVEDSTEADDAGEGEDESESEGGDELRDRLEQLRGE